MNKVFFGKRGEDLACDFLKNKGYRIIDRNFRIRGGEIDIIARDGNTLVFVEVKTRSSYSWGRPEEAVDGRKIKFIERASKFYKQKKQIHKALERIDVVAVDLSSSTPRITLIKNASFD